MAEDVAKVMPTAEDLKACNDWNKAHPPGSPVTFTREDGAELPTSTRSQAYISHDVDRPAGVPGPVILLQAVSGWQPLARVRYDPTRAKPAGPEGGA